MATIILLACSKERPQTSNELLIRISNECRAKIKIYDTAELNKLSDVYDCTYQSILPIQLRPGRYKIVAENQQMKKVSILFKKENYSQEITIEF
ncbi:hypothetical protein FW778_17155 [Ginsengibacter hankyongi]|uniref:Lipoprotein n=1 Tax=Ginsengibacter hankyongi TaxID=2607284 RepID=A0A5J5IEW0_9BACT|nr:hypothetical protein [Ginsengibacter hankyongi]KAA9037157.1 hypothetical protein FW778_17155 [Ginsengibacter hankyongi]